MTRALALAGTGLALLLGIAALASERLLSSFSFLAIPAGQFIATILLPAALAAIVFLVAALQRQIDRRSTESKGM